MAASNPTPQFATKNRPSPSEEPTTRPSGTVRAWTVARARSMSRSAAAGGSVGIPMERAKTSAPPPGRMPSGTLVPARAFTASLIVPSPPSTATTSASPYAALCASSVAWPGPCVNARVSWKAELRIAATARVRSGVTDWARGLTMRSSRWGSAMSPGFYVAFSTISAGMGRGVNLEVLRAVEEVERAKGALVSAAPRGRSAGVPLAEALAAFEGHLRDARGLVAKAGDGWGDADRDACERAIDEALQVARWLRMDASPGGYETLYPILADAMRPLEVFDEVLRRRRG